MTDQELIDKIESYQKILWNKHLSKEELEYLKNRYNDGFTKYAEVYYRMKYNLEERPKCPYCGKELRFVAWWCGYNKFCNHSCAAKSEITKEEVKKKCLEKYGVDHTFKRKDIQERIHSKEALDKAKETYVKNWGVDHPMKSPEYQKYYKKCIENKYGEGITNVFASKEVKEKIKQTSLDKYGVSCPAKSKEVIEKIKQTNLERYGVACNFQRPEIKEKSNTPEVQQKIHEAKKKNGSYGHSTDELYIFNKLKEKYPDVIFQYKDKNRYPFICDFYIPSLDLFIEYQGIWMHGKHPYDKDNIDDKLLLESFKQRYEKSNNKRSQYYKAYMTFGFKDPFKRKTAKENNLNWIEFFTIEEFNNWFINQKENF